MVDFALDDDDRGSNASSDNEQDDMMEDGDDLDAEVDGDGDGDGDEDADDDDNDDDNGEDDQDDGEGEDDSPPQNRRSSLINTSESSTDTSIPGQMNGADPNSHPHPTLTRTSASPRHSSAPLISQRFRYEVRPEALTASTYDIVPTIAAPQSTSINAITATPDMRYWFSGGSDCFIRKYNGVDTVNGKTLLTVAQRHPFVDSVIKAGVLMSYWDNEEVTRGPGGEEHHLSPVYSLAVQSEALWMLSGLESGSINLQSVRHDEGKRIATLQKHTSAVSVLTLARDERSVLSGSWDKKVLDWDLNTGLVKRAFDGSGGQISAIEVRPASTLPVPEESGEPMPHHGTFSSNIGEKILLNGSSSELHGTGLNGDAEGNEDAPGSPADSLFGGGDSLFGDTDGLGAPSGGNFGDDEDEFSKALDINMDARQDSQGDISMMDAPPPSIAEEPAPSLQISSEQPQTKSDLPNGLPHADEIVEVKVEPETQDAAATSDSTFLAASIDGTIRVWDRRQSNPIARILTRTGVPPWCMTACWSPDGNYIYAGRRNGTVEEFSLHKGLKQPERTFKFPNGSGAVSAMRAMPNGRHLIW
ncbi:Transcription factor spt8 [Ciborinia camelliae]|nr:Transcription factor spt8 [Ciborinia camelliae]